MVCIISQLYTRAVALTATIIGTTACEGRKERSLDLLDSIHQKTLRLVWLRERVQKKIKKLNKKYYMTISIFGYMKKEALLLHNTPRPQIYSVRNNYIFNPECAGNTSDVYQQPEAAALCEWPDASTPSACKSLPQASNVTVKESDWVEEVTTSQMGKAE